MSEKISVIVPVYNVEKYLKRCVESILAQTYHHLEIILVNDGSTDSSGEICDHFKALDNRIVVIHKENGGLSDARNKGLDRATGDYICFVDSDDYISPDFIACLYQTLQNSNADIAVTGITTVDEHERELQTFLLDRVTTVVSGEEWCRLAVTEGGISYVVVWNKLYKKSLFQSLRFKKGIFHEDEHILIDLFYFCPKVAVCHRPLYYYRQRAGSIMKDRGNILKRGRDFLDIYKERIVFFQDRDMDLCRLSQRRYATQFIYWFRKSRVHFSKQTLKNLQHEFRDYVTLDNDTRPNIEILLGRVNLSLAGYYQLVRYALIKIRNLLK